MRNLKEVITEKLRINGDTRSSQTFEKMLDVIDNYAKSNNFKGISFKPWQFEFPSKLEYNGRRHDFIQVQHYINSGGIVLNTYIGEKQKVYACKSIEDLEKYLGDLDTAQTFIDNIIKYIETL